MANLGFLPTAIQILVLFSNENSMSQRNDSGEAFRRMNGCWDKGLQGRATHLLLWQKKKKRSKSLSQVGRHVTWGKMWDLEPDRPAWESWLSYSFAEGPWTGYVSTLNLMFLICEIGITIPTELFSVVKNNPLKCLAHSRHTIRGRQKYNILS